MKLIGVGVGGAFTDVVSTDTERDEIVYHGLTIATNALLERKRARTGVVTRGYSSIIRESEDFGATLVDVENRQLAEAPRSTPLQSGPTPAYVHGMRRQLYERGECNRRVWNLPRSKLRLSDLVLGDIEAQIAAARIDARRLPEAIDRYGLDTVKEPVEELFRRSERWNGAVYREAAARERGGR